MEEEEQLVINSTVRNRELNSSGMAIGLNGMVCEEEDPKKNRCPRCDGSCSMLDLDGASSICDVNQYLECLLLN